MILRETAGVVGVGLALGAGLAYAGSRLIDSRLYGVSPQDPLTLLLATGLLLILVTDPIPNPQSLTPVCAALSRAFQRVSTNPKSQTANPSRTSVRTNSKPKR